MANITKRTSADGSTKYLIRVFLDRDSTGKQITKSKIYKPDPKMRPTSADKEAERLAAIFEEQCKQGLVAFAGSTKFEDYANEWVKNEPLSPKTRERYVDLLKRINKAIGHVRLDKLQARQLEEFYRNLSEPGVSERGKYAVSENLGDIMTERKLTREELGKMAGTASMTVSLAARGQHISIPMATKISAALDMDTEAVFTICNGTERLSDKTIHHHHQLISAILAKAKRERLIPFNVAQEHATAPKVARKEAMYMDDTQARDFIEKLSGEDDIRIRTALTLSLFTGVRRGELCGLSWPDIDFSKRIIHVRRASQYQAGKGIVEVPTKNASSVRDVNVPAYVIDMLRFYQAWWNERRDTYNTDWQGDAERLFIQANGKPINPDSINGWLDKVLKKNGLPHYTPHSLRHTFATLQITAGVDIRTLQSRTGHAQASTLVNIYSHAIRSAQEAASNALENVLLPQKQADQHNNQKKA